MHRAVGLLLAIAFVAVCERREDPPTGIPQMSVRQNVSESIAEHMTRDGRFILATPQPPGDLPIISPDRALDLARAFLRTWGRFMGRTWATQRGVPVNLGALEPNPRVLYAETPYELMPRTYHPAERRHYGPWYLVHFREGGEHVLTVAVSAYATDLSIATDGRVVEPQFGGSYFLSVAVAKDPSRGPTQYVPVSPERAVEYVTAKTGARVVEVPRLILRDVDWHPVLAQWRVVLDRPVRVSGEGGRSIVTNSLFVSSKLRIATAKAAQPAGRRVYYTAGPHRDREAPPQGSVELARRPDFAVEYELVALDQPQE